MQNLVLAAAAFLLLHLVVSGSRLRGAIAGRIGEGPYLGLFSLGSLAILVWLGWAYGQARLAPENEVVWIAPGGARELQLGLQLLALMLIAPGMTTPNPTSVRQEAALDRPGVARGMLRITRHPFLWGVALWAAGHLIVNGDAASLILFGSLLALAVFGTASIDAKRRRALGPKWDAFAAQTSNLPFLAIAQRRQRLSLPEIGLWRIALAVAVWALLVWAHPFLFGAPALP